MDIMHVEGRYKGEVKLPRAVIAKLPNRIALLTTVQHMGSLDAIKQQLEESGRQVVLPELEHCKYPGQVLGCAIGKLRGDFDVILYVGDGRFHPKALALENDSDVMVFDPSSLSLDKVSSEDVFDIKRKVKGAYIRFLSAKKVGVLVTTKPGQHVSGAAERLKKMYPDKRFYTLISDEIRLDSLEDFPFIDIFVNTACPRLAYDDSSPKPIIDLRELEKQDYGEHKAHD